MFKELHTNIRDLELKHTYNVVETPSGGYQLKHVVTGNTDELVLESLEAVNKYALRKGFVIRE